ncbi:MAG TPA: TraM recognition domain-containing protein [Gammaproteobacteria bacterium]|nr:TraM recognition domain-containing protein [Gammaproteobacteria bacterium]HRA42304.1 TraM recognition domain-containing protein [Gammaproteobacteria bacterium]
MIRGLDSKQEQSARQLARDTRPLGVRISETLARPEVMLLIFGTSIGVSFAYPMITDVLFIVCTCLFFFSITRKTTLPFRIPRSAHLKDYNDPLPGSNKPRIGEGIFFLGNDRITKEELWFSNDDLRTHVLIFGSTGSGKTEALVSMAFNSLLFASGFIYIDGKGDNSLFAKVFSMVRSMGRDDDMLLINFMTGARDVLGPQKTRLSNTMNPFSRGSSSMLSQLVVSLMSSGKQGGGDDMWTNRAINFVESLMKVLAAMRDAGHILLDANSIRSYFILEKLEQIVIDKRFPISDTYSVPLDNFPKQILEPITAYMDNLPGYNRQKKGNQGSEVREQHGFITMQLTRVFGSLADAYGHIIRTNLAEVDFKDVVLNRRVMVVLLPALEKSPQELSNLGKIIVASLKAMMAAGLGDEVEGDYRDVVLRKPTTASSPFLTIMDEYGYYAVEGFAVVPAQARSLGFSAIFAGQDLPAFQKASKEEAASIGANCNIKICMKLEDPQETWEFFNKVAGESYTTNVSGFQMDSGSLTMNYMDTRSASVDKRQRIDLLDMKDQRPGEFHVFFKSKIIRAETFFAAPKPVKKMRLNQFLKVEMPTEAQLIDMDKRFKRFSQVFATPHYEFAEPAESHDIKILVQSFQGAINLKPFERGIAALISLLEEEVQKQRDLSVPFEDPGVEHEMSAFTKVFVTPMVLRMIGEDNEEMFSLPLIRRGSTTEELIHIERLSGKSEQEAKQLSNSLIEDIESATKFPPVIQFKTEIDQMLQDISDMIVMFGGAPLDISGLKASTASIAEEDETDNETGDETETSTGTRLVVENNELYGIPEVPELPDLEELFSEEPESEDKKKGEDTSTDE